MSKTSGIGRHKLGKGAWHLQLPQPFERLQNPLDLLGAFLVLAAEVGGEGFGGGVGIGADELAEDGDLLRQAVGPGERGGGIVD